MKKIIYIIFLILAIIGFSVSSYAQIKTIPLTGSDAINGRLSYSGNIHSTFKTYSLIDSSWAATHYAPISIVNYTLTSPAIYSALSYTPLPNTGNITINGSTQSYSSNPTFSITSGTTYTTSTPLTLTSGTVIGVPVATTSANGYLSSTDWNAFNAKAPPLSGTGFVYQSGATTSYTASIPESSVTNLTTDLAAKAPINNPTFTGNVTLAQDATSNLQAVTLQQLNNAIAGTDYKLACKYVTVSTLPSYVYNNGTSGVGATITGVGFGAITFDGVTPSVGDRILVTLEISTNTPYNGSYVVTTVGNVAALYVLTRTTDFNQSSEINSGDAFFITAGNTKASSTYVYNGITAPTIGTTNLTFTQTQGAGVYSAGYGTNLITNVFSADTTSSNALVSKLRLAAQLAGKQNALSGTGFPYSTGGTISYTTAIPNSSLANSTFTVNGTAMALGTSSTITSSAGTLTGTLLNSTVVTSSLTTVGTVTAGLVNPQAGGTGKANNSASTYSVTGAFPFTATLTNSTIVTFPTTGTLATTANIETFTNKDLTSLTNSFPVYGGFAPIISGNTRWTPFGLIASSTGWSITTIYFCPYVVGKNHTVTSISCVVNANVASTNVAIALYADDGTGKPGAFIEGSASISAATQGVKTYVFTGGVGSGGSQVLVGQMYWMAFKVDNTSVGMIYPTNAFQVTNASVLGSNCFTKTQSFATAFPNPASASSAAIGNSVLLGLTPQ